MGRKNSPSAKKELVTLITNYEEAKAENRQLYLDADQLADIADWYASERKFEEAQEVITYGLKIPQGAFYLFPKCDSFFGKKVAIINSSI